MTVVHLRDRGDRGTSPESPARCRNLKHLLVVIDALAIAAGFATMIVIVGPPARDEWWSIALMLVAFTVIGLLCVRGQGLFLARVSAMRLVELTRSTRAFGLLALSVVVLDRIDNFGLRTRFIVLATVLSWTYFVIGRGAYRSWVAMRRSHGYHLRRVLLVGADAEIVRLVELFATHPEMGITPDGLVGNRDEAVRNGLGPLWLGDTSQAEYLARHLGVSGVVISSASVSSPRLSRLIRHLHSSGVHVQMATGIAGIDAGRLRTMSMSYEPVLYVEAPSLTKLQTLIKRVCDLAGAGLLLLVTAPVMLVVALLIKLGDRGPVFFRQERVGRDGSTFMVFKFRTMRVDAERMLAELLADNQRNGPLFKMDRDPRVTRIGKFLRDSSLDELPQLINVIRGEMSFVGPRPALPSEVATFGDELRQRETVLPGITGLWQVEARDNPSFEAYRRLDLFYVENWSITLDLLIVLGTIEQIISKLVVMVLRKGEDRSRALHPTAKADADGLGPDDALAAETAAS